MRLIRVKGWESVSLRSPVGMGALAVATAIALASAGVAHAQSPASTGGKWTSMSPTLTGSGAPNSAIHMALLRGEDDWQTNSSHYHSYLFWWENRHLLCGDKEAFHGGLYGWNPVNPNNGLCTQDMMAAGFTRLPIANDLLDPKFDLFCAGHAIVNGKLLVAGGASAENAGQSYTAMFNPHATSGSRWTRQNGMNVPRWYPTIKQLLNNSLIVYAGQTFAQLFTVGGHAFGSSAARTAASRHELNFEGTWDSDVVPDEDPAFGGAGRPIPRDFAAMPSADAGYEYSGNVTRATLVGGRRTGATTFEKSVWQLVHNSDAGSDSLRWWKYPEIVGDNDLATFGLWRHGAISTSTGFATWVYGGLFDDGSLNGSVYKGYPTDNSSPGQPVQWSRKWRWEKFTPAQLPGGPGPRFGACVCYDSKLNRIIVFGGYSIETGSALADSDVYALSLTGTPSWNKLTWSATYSALRPSSLAEAGVASEPSATDPEHLAGASTDAASAYVFGGKRADGTLSSDVWLMYFVGATGVSWAKLPINGSSESPVARTNPIVIRDANSWNLRVFAGDGAAAADGAVWAMDVYRSYSDSCNTASRSWVKKPAMLGGGLEGACGFADHHTLNTTATEVTDPVGQSLTSWHGLTGANRFEFFYPLLFQLPSGKVLDAYARPFDRHTDALTLSGSPTYSAGTWNALPSTAPDPNEAVPGGGSAVMRVGPDGLVDIMKCGSKDEDGLNSTSIGTAARITFPNGNEAAGQWTQTPSLSLAGRTVMTPRIFHNLVTLPSGKVLVTGGLGFGNQTADYTTPYAVRNPQIWNPATGNWSDASTLNPEPIFRGYHAGALLLPSGMVITGGGNDLDTRNDISHNSMNNFAVFCPPNLYDNNNQPAQVSTITAAPVRMQFGGAGKVSCTFPDYVTRVTLVRPGAVTHGFNSSQLFLDLQFSNCIEGVTVTAPDNAHAPPGDYLLFVLLGDVPSVGVWVTLGPDTTINRSSWTSCQGGGSGGGGGGFLEGDFSVGRSGGALAAVGAAQPDYLDNTLFPGVADGEATTDRLLLPHGPVLVGDQLRVRLRHFGPGRDDYSSVRLIAVDHPIAEGAAVDSTSEVSGKFVSAASVGFLGGIDVTGQLLAGRVDGRSGDTLVVDLGGADDGSGMIWIESSGRQEGEGGIRVESLASGEWREVGVVTPRSGRSRSILHSVRSQSVRLVFLGAHVLHGVGRFGASSGGLVRTTLEPTTVKTSTVGEVPSGSSFQLSNGDSAWVDFPAPVSAVSSQRSWFLEVDARPVGYQPSAQQLRAHHAPAGDVPGLPGSDSAVAFYGGAPNPLGDGTTLSFSLPAAMTAKLEIYDAQGRLVRRLAGQFSAGRQAIHWDRSSSAGFRVPPGIYRVRLTAGETRLTKPLVVLR